MPKIVISLLTYNGAEHIDRCLESIEGQDCTDWELVLYDNASTDATVARAREICPSVRFVLSSINRGFAAGHNEVIRTTDAPYILILNQDVFLGPTYLSDCVRALEEYRDCGAVTGCIYKVPALTGTLKSAIVDTCGLGIKRNHYMGSLGGSKAFLQKPAADCPIFGVPGTASLYRRTALEDASFPLENGTREYFDEDFFMYKEDCDIAYRMQWRGWSAYSLPNTEAFHVGSTKPGLLARESVRINTWSYQHHFFLLLKNVSTETLARVWYRILWYEFGKLVYVTFREPRTLIFFVRGRRLWKRMVSKRAYIQSHRTVSPERIHSFLR